VRRIALLTVALAAAAATASAGSAPAPPRMLGPFGTGADAYWLWRAYGKPRAVVVFLHGLDASELTPKNHLPWLRHLVAEGNDVVYPRYETRPGAYGAIRHTLTAVGAALRRLGRPHAPFVVVGYSRGGRLAVEFAAVAPLDGVLPAAAMSIFPADWNPATEERIDLRSLSTAARILILAGQEDSREGARELLARLEQAHFPPGHVQAVLIRSKGSFVADHASALGTGPEARRQFWARLDRLIAAVR
jgi:pimeloyl-ACP methyl ester carboxylesterase